MIETWTPIQGYNGIYEVSSLGNIRSVDRIVVDSKGHEKSIKGHRRTHQINTHRGGYIEISLYKEGKERRYRVHRLVAQAFIPNPLNKPEVNHIDGNKGNNAVYNLEWVSAEENITHAWSTGLSSATHRCQSIMCRETGVVYRSVVECARVLNLHRCEIFRQLKRGVPAYKGFTFVRVFP